MSFRCFGISACVVAGILLILSGFGGNSPSSTKEVGPSSSVPAGLDPDTSGVIVQLKGPGVGDDLQNTIEPFLLAPEERLVLPEVDTAGARFMSLWDPYGDASPNREGPVSILVLKGKTHDSLFVDRNNNNNLRDDGPPVVFSRAENETTIRITSPPDMRGTAPRLLARMPRWAYQDSVHRANFHKSFDEQGRYLTWALYQHVRPGGYEAKKGTFYFVDRLNMYRGKLAVDGDTIALALVDDRSDGIVRYDEDLLAIDLNRDGKLSRLEYDSELFKLTDVFRFAGQHFRADSVSSGFEKLHLSRTNEPVTRQYLQQRAKKQAGAADVQQVDSSLWDLHVSTLGGKTFSMKEYRGRYILLNFWGEWCAPCLAEIPHLVDLREEVPRDSLQIIGFLQTDNLAKARSLMQEEEMKWPQVRLTETLSDRFSIVGFPTNVLIHPDGERYHRMNMVSPRVLNEILPGNDVFSQSD